MPLTSHPIAVFDVETTGFSRSDRIIEIGIVTFDVHGRETGRFESLVQPDRDIPNSHIHGITATMLVGAPAFSDIVGEIAALIDGHVLVAHNSSFDVRFLNQELGRLGYDLPGAAASTVDTMPLCQLLLPGGPRKLSDALRIVGVNNPSAHRALSDAVATAELFYHLLERGATVSATPLQLPAGLMATAEPQAALPRPVPTGQRETDAYQQVLIRALDDGVVTDDERAELITHARKLGLSKEEALEVHRDMLTRIAAMAWADGVLTEAEAKLITSAAASLDVPAEHVDAILAAPQEPVEVRLTPGCRIVFTGELNLPREIWEQKVISLGYTVGGVTKKTGALVAADPNSRSGKARKAREYGIPILTETQFSWLINHSGDEKPQPVEEIPSAEAPEPIAVRDVFPWMTKAEADLFEIVDAWIRGFPTSPLAKLSPRLDPVTLPETIDTQRITMRRWLTRFPQPLASSVEDLRTVSGIGAKSLADTIHALVVAALDSEDVAPTEAPQPAAENTDTGTYDLNADVYATPTEPADADRVATWHALCATELAPGLADAPQEIRLAAQRLDEQSQALRLELAVEAAAGVASLGSADHRVLDIMRDRIFAADPQTLEQVANRHRITRERIRQLEKKALTQLGDQLALLVAALPKRITRPTHRADLLAAHPDLAVEALQSVPLLDALVALSSGLVRYEDWVEPVSAREKLAAAAREHADEHGVIARSALDEVGPAEWIASVMSGWVFRKDVVLTRTDYVSQAAAILAKRGTPMTSEQLIEAIGEGNARSLDNALSRDERTHRTAPGTWSLVAWGGEEFTNVPTWIAARVDKHDGYPLQKLLAEAAEIGVAESTIRTYTANGEFVTDGDQVIRNPEEVTAEANPEEYPGMFVRNGQWQYLLTVTSDHLRGSGFAVPKCLAGMFDVKFLSSRTFTSNDGDQELRFGRTNATSGTIRRFLTALGVGEGDRVWLCFGTDGTFAVTPATPRKKREGLIDVLNHCGIDDQVSDLAGLNEALGLRPDAPRRRTVSRFNHRNEVDMAEIVRGL